LVLADKPDLDFVEREIVDWVIPDLEFDWIVTVQADGKVSVAVLDDQVLVAPHSMPMVLSNLDLVTEARERYLTKRVMTTKGYMAPGGSNFLLNLPIAAYRFSDGVPGIVTAQVILPETPEYGLPDNGGTVLLAFRPLTTKAVTEIGERLGLPGPQVVSAGDRIPGEPSVELPNELGSPVVAFQWAPVAPRTAIVASAVPLAVGLCALIFGAMFYIVTRHARALRALAESESKNRRMAIRDALTGLPNRAHFDDTLEILTSEPDASPVAVMCFDLDRFKAVNDTHGHHAGDAVLKTIATRFSDCVGENGMVARVGGDEFIAVITKNVDRDYLKWLGESMVEAASEPVPFQGMDLTVGASAGVAFWPENGRSAHNLIIAAYRLLYESKDHGRGRVTIAPVTQPQPEEIALAS
jgi:diguanylate cyclase (GGDEF)-like protein